MVVVFHDIIVDMEANKKKTCLKVTELFLRGRKLNISLAFISHFYFKVSKTRRLSATHYFIMKIPHKENFNK